MIRGKMKKGGVRKEVGEKTEKEEQTGLEMDEPDPWVDGGRVPKSKVKNRNERNPSLSLFSGATHVVHKYGMANYVDLLNTNSCFPTLLCKSESEDRERKATIKVASNAWRVVFAETCSCLCLLGQFNTFPTAVHPIQLIIATTGHRLHFPIPADRFMIRRMATQLTGGLQ